MPAKNYNGFDLISKKNIPDCASTGLYFRHRKTGLEVFHLLNNDEENLFAFAFRTPNNKANGAAHIVEHSVFCGSEKYPLKDPFITLESQSVQTFMNALTFPDKTVYPASSIVSADYFNLMSVYADAVFFPNLKREVFLQEGHRIEFANAKGIEVAASKPNGFVNSKGIDRRASMQGVVYNEMKGAFSSFLDVAGKEIDAALLPDTVYAKTSGGDPLEIAKLSYEDFVAFHKKYYVPQNCLVFLYGNIPTEKQLEFLQENVLNKIEKNCHTDAHAPKAQTSIISTRQTDAKRTYLAHTKVGAGAPLTCVANSSRAITSSLTSYEKIFLDEILKSETQRPFTTPRALRTIAPHGSGETKPTAVVSWLWGNADNMDNYAEAVFLGSLLCAHDGSPLSSALLKSGLGADISQCSGADASIRQISFTIGLRGVKNKCENKVKEFIFVQLERLYREGIDREDIEATFNAIDFDNREIKRFQEPFSLVLMRRALRTWNYGGEPANGLFVRDAFERLKKKINSNPHFIQDLIKEYLLQNKHFVFTVIVPDKEYLKEREQKEKEIIAQQIKKLGKEKIAAEAIALQKFQNPESEDLSCLPHIRPKDLKVYDEKLKIRRADITVGGKGNASRVQRVPLFVSRENTNGIVYATAAFPMDIFESSLYPYLPFFAYILNEVGWGDVRWDKASQLIAKTCGAFSTTSFSNSGPNTDASKEMLKTNRAFANRQWLFCKIKMLDNKIQDGFNLMRDCILGANYNDKKRVQTLAHEMLNELESSILPAGHMIASGRAECCSNRECAIEEVWGGLSQLFTLRKICADIDGTIEKMNFIASKIFKAGAVLHVCADDATMPFALKAVKKFACELNLHTPSPRFKISDSEIYSLTDIAASTSSGFGKPASMPKGLATSSSSGMPASARDEAIVMPGMVGFAALTFKSSKYGTREAVAEKVLAHILTSGNLWDKIRTEGGAYGAFATTDAIDQTFTFCTYRDPDPQKSLAAFDWCLEQIARTKFDEESVEKAVTGSYSADIQPKTPSGRGTAAFLRQLYLIDNREKLEQTRILKTITAADIQAAAKRLLKMRKKGAKNVVILPKNAKTTSNFQRIEL